MTTYTRKKISELYHVADIENVEIIGKILEPITFLPSTNYFTYLFLTDDIKQSPLVHLLINNRDYPDLKQTFENAYKSKLTLIVRGNYSKVGYISVNEAEVALKKNGELSLVDNLEGKISLADGGNLSLE